MRIGLVCPYSFDVPGGVQNHVRGLARALSRQGHVVRVLAPGSAGSAGGVARGGLSERAADGSFNAAAAGAAVGGAQGAASIRVAAGSTPRAGSTGAGRDGVHLSAVAVTGGPLITYVGRAMPVAYNGSVARLAFDPRAGMWTRRWLTDGDFDVLHVHEPTTPSVSLLALRASTAPVVATFHTSTDRSRMLESVENLLRPSLARLAGRIAVSETARATLVQHLGGDPIVIPNGIDCSAFAPAKPRPEWSGSGSAVVFLGRADEPRKGLEVMLKAFVSVLRECPEARLIVAGRGKAAALSGRLAGVDALSPQDAAKVTFVGEVSDAERADLLASAAVYVAPHTGGESFGIVLLEAMAAGAPVVASDLSAFVAVLGGGRFGELFRRSDPAAAAEAILRVLRDPGHRQQLRAAAAEEVRRYDWSRVTPRIEAVYDAALTSAGQN